MHDHQVQKEHLHRRDDRDDVRNQLAMALAIDEHRNRPEHRQQEHPEHDRAVEPAPVRGDPVEQRLHAVGVVVDVLDGIVADEERVDDDGRRHGHQRGNQIERADAALDQPPRTAPRADDRDDAGVAADDERGEQQKCPQ